MTLVDEAWLLAQSGTTEMPGPALHGTVDGTPGLFTRDLIRDPDSFTEDEAVAALNEMGLAPTPENIARLTRPRDTRSSRAGRVIGAGAASLLGRIRVLLRG